MDASRRAFSVAIFCRRAAGPDAGRVLLVRHKRLGTWLPVGGELVEGETPLQGAVRELREETGWTARFVAQLDAVDGAPVGLVAYEEHPAGSKGLHLNFCFVADVDDVPLQGNDEFDDHRFVDAVTVDALPCPANVRQLVKRAVSGGRPAPVDVARRWLRAFNDRDLDGLVGLYADDAVHVSPKLRDRRPDTGGEIAGRAALRAWWDDAFARLPALRYEERRVVAEGDSVFLEYVRKVPGEADLVVAELYVMDGHGLIRRSHVFHG
jgi:8-oxo-dGTP diphosphatase